MKMISFSVKKGGVGKTTLVKNIAYKLALEGKKILLIDLDPQATLSMQMTTENVDNKKSLIKMISAVDVLQIWNLIQPTKYKNINIIVGNEELNKSSALLNTLFNEKDRYLIADMIYQNNKNTLDYYDYILIDYPPTVQELALSFLMLSDLIIAPINAGSGSYKGIKDLQQTLFMIARDQNSNIPEIKIIFNNIKDNENTVTIYKWLQENNLIKYLTEIIIKNSDSFITTENDLNSIWDNQHYWRQKQAYEAFINEIK